jgi:hypothetical protein
MSPMRSIDHVGDGVNIFQNIQQPDELRARDHLEDFNCFRLDRRPQHRMQPVARGKIGLASEN